MSVPGGVNLAMLSSVGGAAPGGYEIERSLRFNSADSAYLDRTPSSAGNRKTWTWAGWVKRGDLAASGVYPTLIHCRISSNTDDTSITFTDTDGIRVVTGVTNALLTTQVFRDYSAWYHIVCAFDTTQSTASDRIKLYVNGIRVTDFSSTSYPSQNSDWSINSTGSHRIGRYTVDVHQFSGYLADVYLVDGQALDPTDFGEFDDNGVWQPIEYAGTYGTNGFHLDFSDNSTAAALGTDTSGNGNTWTVNNITASEYRVIDAPTLSNGAMIVRGVSGGSVTVTISGSGTKNYFTSSDGIDWTWQSSATNATYSANYIASGGAGTNNRTAVSNGAFQYAMWNTNTNFDSTSNTTTDTTGLTFTTATANGSNADSLRDSPTNGDTANDTGLGGEVPGNYATWNPLKTGDNTSFAQGNLFWRTTSNAPDRCVLATIGMSSGKWYWECYMDEGTATAVGIAPDNVNLSSAGLNEGYGYYSATGEKYHLNTGSSYGDTFATGDLIGIAYDADNGNLYFYKNGVVQDSGTAAFTGISGTHFPMTGDSGGASQSQVSVNFGQRAFAYSAPSGYKALCTTNLDDPTIADGSTAMDVALWTGTNTSAARTISGLKFSPDLVWAKARSLAYSNNIYDTVRGTGQGLYTDSTQAEATNSPFGYISTFTSDGFTGTPGSTDNGFFNETNATYVGWTWDAGTSTVSNTDGSITSSVRANPSAGFSIVTYTGNGSAGATVGHGLNAAPSLIIRKSRSASASWFVYHSSLGATKYILLQTTGASQTSTDAWNDTAPTSSVFSNGSDGVTNSGTFVAYCFTPVEGYSAFGSYTGNGAAGWPNADGPFIHLGFRPRFILWKCTSQAENWHILDSNRGPYNFVNNKLLPNSSAAETVNNNHEVDFLSNGFKLRNNTGELNQNGATYVYAAFAENPFKTARAR